MIGGQALVRSSSKFARAQCLQRWQTDLARQQRKRKRKLWPMRGFHSHKRPTGQRTRLVLHVYPVRLHSTCLHLHAPLRRPAGVIRLGRPGDAHFTCNVLRSA